MESKILKTNFNTPFKSEEFYKLCLFLKVAEFFQKSFLAGTIFGGFVRDLLLFQKNIFDFDKEFPGEDFWNPNVGNLKQRVILPKDIDVCFIGEKVRDYLRKLASPKNEKFQKRGFFFTLLGEALKKQKSEKEKDYALKVGVFPITATLTNSALFFGKEISIDIDLVFSEKDAPPFGRPDLECNMFCYHAEILSLMDGPGDPFGKISNFESEFTRGIILSRICNKVTTMYPLPELQGDTFSPENVFVRKSRVKRIIRAVERGWKIENLEDISLVENVDELAKTAEIESGNYLCCFCHDSESRDNYPQLRFNCCRNYAHSSCFVAYSDIELQNRTHIRCPNMCAKRDTHLDII